MENVSDSLLGCRTGSDHLSGEAKEDLPEQVAFIYIVSGKTEGKVTGRAKSP